MRILTISVVFPVKNREHFVKRNVGIALRAKDVREVIVVDGGSTDGTVESAIKAGAKAVVQTKLIYPGKGIAMMDGAYMASEDVIVFVDIDIKNFETSFIENLAKPVIEGKADFVKGRYQRKAGRVTELVAKPLLRMFYPELASFKQPLSGEIAGTRTFFHSVEFEQGWGVDVGLLIDAFRMRKRMTEVDLGYREHEMKPLHMLTDMAYEVAEAILKRAVEDGRLSRRDMGRRLVEVMTIAEDVGL